MPGVLLPRGGVPVTPPVWFGSRDLAWMAGEAARMAPLETGGVLVGYGGPRDGYLVTAVVGPGPDAVHERHRFVPDAAFHTREVARLYRESGRTEVYLGDWHSHPDGEAYLSSTDRRTLRAVAQSEEARSPCPIMVVLGGRTGAVRAWHLTPHRARWRLRPVPCAVRTLRS